MDWEQPSGQVIMDSSAASGVITAEAREKRPPQVLPDDFKWAIFCCYQTWTVKTTSTGEIKANGC